jgi:hypothetical protein
VNRAGGHTLDCRACGNRVYHSSAARAFFHDIRPRSCATIARDASCKVQGCEVVVEAGLVKHVTPAGAGDAT